jgi:hypothetical protein
MLGKTDIDLELLDLEQESRRQRKLFSFCIAPVVVFIFLCRIFLMVKVPLTGDEAYYWLWAKHLALGYHDQPPLIGWLISLSTFFSNRIFWVRLPALLCSIGSAIFFYAFARDFLQDGKKARLALLFFLLLPIFSIAEVALIPDVPLIFSWAFCLWAGWKSLRDGRYWPLTGLALGLAILSKLMAFFLFASFFLLFILNRHARFWLAQKSFWLGILVSTLVSSPFWFWNIKHGFENFAFQAQDHLGSTHFSILSFLAYLGLQSVSVSPMLFLLFVPVAGMLIKKSWNGDLRSQFLLSFFLPIHAFFAFTAFRVPAASEIHWASAGYLSLLVASADLEGFKKLKKIGLVNCIIFSIFFSFVFAFPTVTARMLQPVNRAYPSLEINPFLRDKDYGELLGYRQLAIRVKKQMKNVDNVDPSFVLTDSYQLSSEIAYYAHEPALTLLPNGQGGEYARWQNFNNHQGQNALWVCLDPFSKIPKEKEILQKAFKKIGPEETIHVRNGPVVRTFYEAMLFNLQNPKILEHYPPGVF